MIIVSVLVIVASSGWAYAQLLPAGNLAIRLISIPKNDFVDGEIIPISGYTLPNSTVNISLSDNLGNLENSTQVSSNNTGYFYTNLGIPSHVIGGGSWHIFAKSLDNYKSLRIRVNTHGVVTMPDNFPSGLAPLKQFKLGIPTDAIQCDASFQLVLKTEDGSPVCVKPDTANILIKRGWASSIIATPPMVQQTSGNATLPTSFMPCDTPYPQNGTGVAVFHMPVNSIGKICVRYSNFNDFPAPLGIRASNANNMNQNATEITTWDDQGNRTTIPKGNTTVVYWIKTGNQTGLYALTIFCSGMPFAVGYDNQSSITVNDFPWVNKIIACPLMSYQYNIVGLSNVGIWYIPNQIPP